MLVSSDVALKVMVHVQVRVVVYNGERLVEYPRLRYGFYWLFIFRHPSRTDVDGNYLQISIVLKMIRKL